MKTGLFFNITGNPGCTTATQQTQLQQQWTMTAIANNIKIHLKQLLDTALC